jgi:AraC-like DNA-binding protein
MNKISKTITYNAESSIRRLHLQALGADALLSAGIRYGVVENLHHPTEKGRDTGVEHVLVLYLVHGRMEISVGDQRTTIEDGQVLAVPPHPTRWLSLQSSAARLIALHFDPVDPWQRFLRGTPRLSSQIKSIEWTMEQLLNEDLAIQPGLKQARQHLSELLLLYLSRDLGDHDNAPIRRHRRTLMDLWAQVNAQLDQPWSIDLLAAKAHISPPHLHKLSKSLFGTTPMQMVNRLRMEQAKTLLVETEQTVDQIAGRVGYTSPYSFSDSFLKHSGVRPGRYRRQIIL